MQGHIPPEAIQIFQSFFFLIGTIALGVPLIRAITKRWERPSIPSSVSADVTERLERIEQAVEAVAIEVERIAEAQRFATKLMAEQQRALPKSDAAK